MFGLFKKKLSPDEIAIAYLDSLVRTIEEQSDNDQIVVEQALVEFQGLDYDIQSLNHFNFEVMVATIAMEFQVIKNLFPDKYISVTQAIYRNIRAFMNYDEAEEYALSSIQRDYIPQIEIALREGFMPHESVVEILIGKLNIDYTPITSAVFSEILLSKIGFWKYALNKYKLA